MEAKRHLNLVGLTNSYTILAILDLNRESGQVTSSTAQIWKRVNKSRRELQDLLSEHLPAGARPHPARGSLVISAPSVHEVVNRLVTRGVLERKPGSKKPGCPGRPTVQLTVTPAGEQMLLSELDRDILSRELQLQHLRSLRAAIARRAGA